ncbi:DUF1513 domain-containing protein [Sneathiella marina]|uniref:DUF1513 domain-containing protein n=1 Tax=Sneathiella marina TaxID=2950108 RepID=A0ABY4W189_9PROT|nr:DUF1513 domain-containing protein [Sneathiella marina]USG60843.1 DUF1513 domain-containing protein [Sneathiella marina]
MVINRRQFIAMSLVSGIIEPQAANSQSTSSDFISCLKGTDGFAAARLDHQGAIKHLFPLPARGHDIALSPQKNKAVIFSRRPGRIAILLDLTENRIVAKISSHENRHFYGHGFFSPDGNLLYAAENNFEFEQGCIGIYDAQQNYRRIGEYDCHGIGPHETVLLADKNTIACAIGGIATHPEYPRQKLNIANMAPSLNYLDRDTGSLIEKVPVPANMHKLSLRHIVEGPDKTVWFCGQYEGPASDKVSIVGYHISGQPLNFVELPKALIARTKQYAGSIAINSDLTQVGVTFPRGNILALFSTESKQLTKIVHSQDVCGIAGVGHKFFASNGKGEFFDLEGVTSKNHGVLWDNHLQVISN